MRRLVLASNNPGKLREFRQMLAPLGIEITPQAELGIPESDEPHGTFIENALAKARNASRRAGLPAFADDSGICVAALGGAPGVQSARYADGASGTREDQDARNNRKLIEALAGHGDRRAHYYCVIVLVRHAADPQPLIAEGRWQGEVITAPRGAGGFGHDPYFLPARLGRPPGAVIPAGKDRRTHRGPADD